MHVATCVRRVEHHPLQAAFARIHMLLFSYCTTSLPVILPCHPFLSYLYQSPLHRLSTPTCRDVHLRQSHASFNPLCPQLSILPSCHLHHLQIIHIASTLARKKSRLKLPGYSSAKLADCKGACQVWSPKSSPLFSTDKNPASRCSTKDKTV